MNNKIILIILLIIASLIVGCASTTGNAVSDISTSSKAEPVDGNIRIPVSEVTSTLKKYSLDADGVEVKYFLVRGSDGEIRTALDACEVCGGYTGYRQQGDDVVCNNCGRHFSIDSLGTKNLGGGCWPSHLSHTIDGNEVVIKVSDIGSGALFFR